MFQVFPSMKNQPSQISLTRLCQILPEAQPIPYAEEIETIILSFFDDSVPKEKVQQSHQQVDHLSFDKKEFLELVTKPLLKILKRQQKKIEQLVQFHSRPSPQQQLNRIKLDKILKQCFLKIQKQSGQVHRFIEYMEDNAGWQCNCKKPECEERKSLDQFWVDIFGYFYRTSKIIQKQILFSLEREVQLHYFYSCYDGPSKEDWKFGYRPTQLLLHIEKNCELSKAKKKKRNKKNKEKVIINERQEKFQQLDQDQRILNAFMQNFDLFKLEKDPCFVTQEWRAKIANKKISFKK